MKQMIKTLYLVTYIGIYDDSECDHTTSLHTTKKEGIKAFHRSVKECKDYYNNENGKPFKVDYDAKNYTFVLKTLDEEDVVHIYLQEIKADGKLNSTIF